MPLEQRPQLTGTQIWRNSDVWFLRYTSGQTDKQTDRQTYRHADHNILYPPGGEVGPDDGVSKLIEWLKDCRQTRSMGERGPVCLTQVVVFQKFVFQSETYCVRIVFQYLNY